MTSFDKYAGQLVAHGIKPNMPAATLEQSGTTAISTFQGLLPKISRVFIEETRIFGDRFGGLAQVVNDPFGVGIEIAGFQSASVNKKLDGRCFPRGTVPMVAQVAYTNYAYNQEVTIADDEVNKFVLDAATAGAYAAQKLRAPLKTQAQMKYLAWKQLLSGVVSGTRSIVSNERSDGTGDAVTYTATVVPYVNPKMVNPSEIVIPAPGIGIRPEITAQDALEIALELRAAARDMGTETSDNNALEIENFTLEKPLLVMEEKVLDAMDEAWSVHGGFVGVPTVDARTFLRNFAQLVEIDLWPELPTNAEYADYRLGAVLLDRSGMREIVKKADVEPDRCVKERSTGYSFQGESILAIWRGSPAYALLVNPGVDEGA